MKKILKMVIVIIVIFLALWGIKFGIEKSRDDVEEKWVVAPDGCFFSREEIRRQTWFQERFFDSEIWMGEDPE